MDIDEKKLFHKPFNAPISVEEEVESKKASRGVKKCYKWAFWHSKRRLKMYYFNELTLDEIAMLEKLHTKQLAKVL